MRHLQQPANSNLCGQTCVAMVAGVPIEEAVRVFGKRGSTRTSDVVKALAHYGLKTKTARLVKWDGSTKPPDNAILKLTFDERKHKGHWVLQWNGILYDPSLAEPNRYCGGRFTSYLELEVHA